MAAIETILAVASLVATVASTGYSIYSSEQAESEAHKEKRKARAAEAQRKAALTQEAAKAESRRIQRTKGFLSTFGASGLSGIPQESWPGTKTTLG